MIAAKEISWTKGDAATLIECPVTGDDHADWFDPHKIQGGGHPLTGKGAVPRRPLYRLNRLRAFGFLFKRIRPDFQQWAGKGPEYDLRHQFRRARLRVSEVREEASGREAHDLSIVADAEAALHAGPVRGDAAPDPGGPPEKRGARKGIVFSVAVRGRLFEISALVEGSRRVFFRSRRGLSEKPFGDLGPEEVADLTGGLFEWG